MRITLLRGNDQVLQLPRLRTGRAPITYLNAATAEAVLQTTADPPVTLLTIPLTYVAASDGTYEGPIEGPTFLEPEGLEYQLVVTAVEAGQHYRTVLDVWITDAP